MKKKNKDNVNAQLFVKSINISALETRYAHVVKPLKEILQIKKQKEKVFKKEANNDNV